MNQLILMLLFFINIIYFLAKNRKNKMKFHKDKSRGFISFNYIFII